ncbi:hypothetical protein TrCOL_g8331 [Triparma columacea]|jgi:hypothetical protein|uniref:Uncharacterized protein n=1 Tax=Triparma columacea TaxID=722753 RepID=A0A9W7G169_9STRA|nr:hypothetical protein TrCOL_g8331 [Triparma columacea]
MRFGPESGPGDDGPPKDGHMLGITASQNDFMKEIMKKDSAVSAAFKANKTVYRTTRNCILAEHTPREPTRKRMTDDEFRSSMQKMGRGGLASTLKAYGGVDKRIGGEGSEGEVDAAKVDIELEKLYAKKKQIEMKVKELDRLLKAK